ncbi:MAG: DUF1569 domain-containing protein [Bacteroidota bacterium]
MENLFAPSSAEKIISRIGQLNAGLAPLWGKMNVGQMLAHCRMPLIAGIGDAKFKRSFIGFLFGSIIKRQFLKGKPFKKNLPTDKSFIMTEAKFFDDEKQQLVEVIKRFTGSGPGAFKNNVHPFFGQMSAGEWGILSWKHLDHHLQQFGV